jgi:serine/threonine protein kinase
MSQATPIDDFCQGRLGLPELLSKIERTFIDGDGVEQTALLESWRKNEFKKVLDQRVFSLIDEKIETEYNKSRLGKSSGYSVDDKTVIMEVPSPATLRPGLVLKGRFILEEVLGSGGMGVVFRAVDLRKKEAQDRDPNIAIKVLNEDFRKHPDSFRALQREARKAQNLAHPNIITVYDFDREDSLIYLTMEYLSGSSLEKRMKAYKTAFPLNQVMSIVKSVGAALSYAHENGIVHSDLKPANIFISNNGRVKVIDFGIARAIKRADQQDGGDTTIFDPGRLHALTPAYASIEMIEGREPDARDDIYALGCITYELVTGRHPFGRMMATEALAAGLEPKKPEQLSAKQWRALSRAISLDREHRIGSASEFCDEFLSVQKNQRFVLTPVHIGAAAGVIVLCLVGAYLLIASPFHSTRSEPSKQLASSDSREEFAQNEAERRTAAAIALARKQEAERVAGEAASKKEAAEAAEKKEADRLAAEAAAKKETERLAAEAAAKKEVERLAAEAAVKKEVDRVATEAAAKKEAERLVADAAAKKETDRLAAESTAKREAQRQAAEAAAKNQTDRLAEAAAKKDAERKAADAAKKDTVQRANPTSSAPPNSTSPPQIASLNLPRLTDAALVGAWCAGSLKIRLSPTEWRFQLPGGETKLAVTGLELVGDKIVVHSVDDQNRETVTEFGNFSNDQMTQIRGRLAGAAAWNNYNRVFKRC